jgi:penicillin V acylase-like amidase (Ntn superfamily)
MKIGRYIFLCITVCTLLLPGYVRSCTTFCFEHNGEWVYGRNYDWSIEHCLIIVNKRGVAKTAWTQDNPAQWVSKYGSISFNQYGREFPLGGMNEAGLVIECMWLEHTEYPHTDTRKGLSDLQWIQYQLDNFATVDEVIASDKNIRISVRYATPLHFLVCDRTGKAATVEFLEGEMVVHTQDDLPATALTNNTYEYSIRLFNMFDGNETSDVFDAADYSLKRFVWVAQGVNKWNPKTCGPPVRYAFNILDKVSIDFTMFRIVYDVGNKHIYLKTKSNPSMRFINVNKFNFSCDTPVKILDISTGKEGDVTTLFSDYTYEANYDLICRSFSETEFLKNIPEQVLQTRAHYPETLPCEE